MELDLSQATIPGKEAPVQQEEATNEISVDNTLNEVQQDTPQETAAASPYSWVDEDDFAKDLLNHYKNGGDIEEYLSVSKRDYDSMDPISLHKESLKAGYGDLPPEMFEEYFGQYIEKQYGISPNDLGEDDSLAKRLIEKDAEAIRSKLKEEQSKYKQSGTNNYEKQLKEWQDSVLQLDPVKQFQDEKVIKVKVGDDVVNFEVDNMEEAMDITLNNDKFWTLFADERGQTDWSKWFEVLQFAKNPDAYKKAILNTGKTKGTEKLLDELENPSIGATNKGAVSDPFSSAEAFLKSAKIRK
jgi:hypothetical protein